MSDPRSGYYILIMDKDIMNVLRSMNNCPCCSHSLLRHIRQHHVYWFCPRCRLEMPNLEEAAICPQVVRKSKPLAGMTSL
ncbi:MAG: hypothetical protein ACHBN1_18070 [Heteroscytonema crispum UTEX LB 1556]